MKCIAVDNLYQKDKELNKKEVEALLEWISKQAHLPEITERQVIIFLQSCYYNSEQAKQTIDNFFTIKTLCPDIFGNRNPKHPSVINAANVGLISFLPEKTKENYTVVYMTLMDCNPDNYNYTNQLKYFDMLFMAYLNLFGPSEGFVMIIDMKGSVLGHLIKVSLVHMKKFLYYLQEAMPIRLKTFHFINVVSFIDKVMAMAKPFMKKELADSIRIHNNIDSLYEYVPKECLPKEFGGNADSKLILHEKSKAMLFDNADFFNFEESQKVDESKRTGRSKNAGDFFGVEGTFKKLEVD